ncbi:hypothetical protein F0U61_06195 [Archangium violaceum]|uniref:hypothetical protein n=1 Tax=Archangium violaceum TaxID=83451 RepID=UPI002B2D5C35|nr:hypothetical protein F0U61_06195 [Archangium violaceum]
MDEAPPLEEVELQEKAPQEVPPPRDRRTWRTWHLAAVGVLLLSVLFLASCWAAGQPRPVAVHSHTARNLRLELPRVGAESWGEVEVGTGALPFSMATEAVGSAK